MNEQDRRTIEKKTLLELLQRIKETPKTVDNGKDVATKVLVLKYPLPQTLENSITEETCLLKAIRRELLEIEEAQEFKTDMRVEHSKLTERYNILFEQHEKLLQKHFDLVIKTTNHLIND